MPGVAVGLHRQNSGVSTMPESWFGCYKRMGNTLELEERARPAAVTG